MDGRDGGDGKGRFDGVANLGQRLGLYHVGQVATIEGELMKFFQKLLLKNAFRTMHSNEQKIIVGFKIFDKSLECFQVWITHWEKLLEVERKTNIECSTDAQQRQHCKEYQNQNAKLLRHKHKIKQALTQNLFFGSLGW